MFLEDSLAHLDLQISFGTKKGSIRGQEERLEGLLVSWRLSLFALHFMIDSFPSPLPLLLVAPVGNTSVSPARSCGLVPSEADTPLSMHSRFSNAEKRRRCHSHDFLTTCG